MDEGLAKIAWGACGAALLALVIASFTGASFTLAVPFASGLVIVLVVIAVRKLLLRQRPRPLGHDGGVSEDLGSSRGTRS